jgi:DNA ligase-associated metallophosphoesterase
MKATQQKPRARADSVTISVNGASLLADASGALIWPQHRAVLVADLHLEKGSSFAARGRLLPPYDTAATLMRLEEVLTRHDAKAVFCLGDSFHDAAAGERLSGADRARIASLTGRCDWTWICGNHDPAPPADWGGKVAEEVTLGPLTFRHQAVGSKNHGAGGTGEAGKAGGAGGEVSGHFHPKAALRWRHKRITGRCFITDGRRLILPAFGAYTGGLNVLDPAIAGLFPKDFQVLLMGRAGIFSFPSSALVS